MSKSLYSYAIFALPLSFIGVPLYIYLPEYYLKNFNIPLATIGFIILLTRLFDTITDPICGFISDKLLMFSKQIICFSALMIGFCFYALFVPVFNDKILNLSVFSVLTYLFFSLLTINHLALIRVFKNKVLASSVREGFTVIGLFFAILVPSLLVLKYSSLQTFKIIGICLFIALLLCVFLFYKNVNINYAGSLQAKNSFKLGDINKPIFWRYFTVLFFNGMAIATPSTLVIFYIKNFLELEKYTGVFLTAYFASAIIFIPMWKYVCNKIGAVKLLRFAMLGSVGVFWMCYFVNKGNIGFYLVICVLSGAFFGIDLIAPNIITNSIVEQKNIEHSQTLVFGITHFISKISVAIVSGLVLIILGGRSGNDYNTALHFFYTIIPCVFKIMALVFIYRLRV